MTITNEAMLKSKSKLFMLIQVMCYLKKKNSMVRNINTSNRVKSDI